MLGAEGAGTSPCEPEVGDGSVPPDEAVPAEGAEAVPLFGAVTGWAFPEGVFTAGGETPREDPDGEGLTGDAGPGESPPSPGEARVPEGRPSRSLPGMGSGGGSLPSHLASAAM